MLYNIIERKTMKKKSKKICSFNLETDLIDKLENHSEKTKLSKTAIVEIALEEYFKKKELK